MTEHHYLRRCMWVLPLLLCAIASCAGKTSSTEGSGGTSAGGSNATGGATPLGGSASTGGAAGNDSSCTIDSDCVYTEISSEILKPADCPCLYGCPFIIVNRATNDRRKQQFTANCDGRHNGQGDLCGIDDCIMPPSLFCFDGTCLARE